MYDTISMFLLRNPTINLIIALNHRDDSDAYLSPMMHGLLSSRPYSQVSEIVADSPFNSYLFTKKSLPKH
jgi:hypothetical protein